MTQTRRRFIAISAATAACSIAGVEALPAPIEQWQGTALGAGSQIRLAGLDQGRALAMLAAVRKEISRLENLFSLFRPGSALCRLNADGELTDPPPEMLELASRISAIHRLSTGLFDPTVQPLWNAYAEAGGKPARSAISMAVASVGWPRVVVEPRRILLPQGGALTFNGIAQGYVTDKVVRLLRAGGLRLALVEVGEIGAIGAPAGKAGWPVHLGSASGPKVRLRDRSIATSAPSGTVFSSDGESHLINPVTGKPATSGWARTTVIHESAAMADAMSTAAALMTPEAVAQMVSLLPGTVFMGLHARYGGINFEA